MLNIPSRVVCIGLLLSLAGVVESAEKKPFVQVKGSQFVLAGKPYYFAGTNFWYGCYLGATQEGQKRLVTELDALKSLGVTNLRVLGASEESTIERSVKPAIQTKLGVLDESLLKGLDFLLAEMSKRDMKAVIFLNNYWEWSGGMGQYLAWVNEGTVIDPGATGNWSGFMANSARFYSSPAAEKVFHDFMTRIINRKNTITGIIYKDDPTIMTWELANEPRPGPDGAQGRKNLDVFYKWIQETAAFVKGLDANHLVTTGSEGTWGCLQDDQVFLTTHSVKEIDYATFHLWPKNWSWFRANRTEQTLPTALKNAQAYFDKHVELGKKLGKPMVLEEFGLDRDNGSLEPNAPTTARDQFLKQMYDAVYGNASQGGMMAGTNVWSWGGLGRRVSDDGRWKPGDPYTGDPPQEAQGLNSIFSTDQSTLALLREHGSKMQSLCSKAPPNP
jgi:mannan endo-1,4-beta-mannosidase